MKWIGLAQAKNKPKEVASFFEGLGKEIDWCDSIQQINEFLSNGESGIVILSALQNPNEDIYEVCRQLSQIHPNLAIVLLAEETQLDMRKAMRSGVFDVLTLPLKQPQVIEIIREAENYAANQSHLASEKPVPTKMAKIITVCSTKGGVGKTTFTVNLAAAFAKQFKKVAIIDLDLQFGDISMFFDCNPKKTIYEWVKEGQKHPADSIEAYMHAYNDYIDIMPAPLRPEFSEAILEEHISQLILKLKPYYDLVLVDTAPFMEDKILTALEKSDHIFLLTFLDLPTLKNSKIFIDTLNSLSLGPKVKVVLNRDSKKKGLNSITAERILGLPIFIKIPDVEKIVAVSVNEGNPYIYSNPRAKISKIIYSLALEVSGDPKKQPKKSLFGRKVLHVGRQV